MRRGAREGGIAGFDWRAFGKGWRNAVVKRGERWEPSRKRERKSEG